VSSPKGKSGQRGRSSTSRGYNSPGSSKIASKGSGAPSTINKSSKNSDPRKNSQRNNSRKQVFGSMNNVGSSPSSGYSSPSPSSGYSSPSSARPGYSSPNEKGSRNAGRRNNQQGGSRSMGFAPLDYGIVSSSSYNGISNRNSGTSPKRKNPRGSSSGTVRISSNKYGAPGANNNYGAPGSLNGAGGNYDSPEGGFGDSYGATGAGDSYGAPGAGDSYGASIAGDSYGAPEAGDSYGAPETDDSYGAPSADEYGAPGVGESYGSPSAGQFGALGLGDSYGPPFDNNNNFSDSYGAPGTDNNFGSGDLNDNYDAPSSGAPTNFGGSKSNQNRSNGFIKNQATSSGSTADSSYGAPNGEDAYNNDSYGAPASNLLNSLYDDYEYDELPTYGRHGRDLQIESPSMTPENASKEPVDMI